MRRIPSFLLLSSFVSLTPLPSPAGDGGSLAGSVRTPDGAPLPHLVLLVSGPSGARTVVTGPDGRYRAPGLAAGAYTITLEQPGFVLRPAARADVGDGETALELTVGHAPVREHVVVSATRSEAPLSTLGIAVGVLDRERIEERQAPALLSMLQELPGLAAARTGPQGAQGSAFVRGGNSNAARVLVDGVPVNEPGGAFNFGTAVPLELERIEVVRGAASSVYGTDALAGVIHVVTRQAGPGEGPGVHAEAEGGSFAWRRAAGGTSGRSGPLDWNAGLSWLETDNEAPNSAFDQLAGALAAGTQWGGRTSLRLTFRGEKSDAGTPGQTAFGRPDEDASFERAAWVAGAGLRVAGEGAVHGLRLGYARTSELSLNPIDSGPFTPTYQGRTGAFEVSDFPDPAGLQNDTRRLSLGYQLEAQAGRRHLLTAGADVERETGELGSRSAELLSPERTNFGLYLQDQVVLGDRVFVTAGGRVERNDSFGTRAVPRAAVAWRARGGHDALTVRASAGAGIKEPSFFESFGVSFFAQGNPDLKPERSRTFDLGAEQRLLGNRLRLEATLYHHDYRDQIAFTVLDFATFQGSFVNVGRTRARGVEVAVDAIPAPRLRFHAAYTYLDGRVLVSTGDFDPVLAAGRPLLRRPTHQLALSGTAGTERFDVGATLVAVGRRADSDFAGLGLTENEGYTRLDARARLRLLAGLEAFVVGENLLDEEYHEALGYPALGRSVRAGIRYRSGGP
jgi:outer membrane cobalamin receptor